MSSLGSGPGPGSARGAATGSAAAGPAGGANVELETPLALHSNGWCGYCGPGAELLLRYTAHLLSHLVTHVLLGTRYNVDQLT